MTNYSFADGFGNSIAEGYQTNTPRKFAREWLEAHPEHECVEYWETGDDSGVEGEPCDSLRTVWR